jgi:hypothetical protein
VAAGPRAHANSFRADGLISHTGCIAIEGECHAHIRSVDFISGFADCCTTCRASAN